MANSRIISSPALRKRAAFTLIEILVVLALIGMLTGVLIVGTTHMVDKGPSSPAEVFWNATRAARKQALLSGHDVRVSFNAPGSSEDSSETSAALVAAGENGGRQTFPFAKMGDVICEFLTTQKGSNAILVGGELVETQTLPFITFYGDGTCTPCRIQFRINGSPQVIAIDPWTCAEMLVSKEAAR